jgi:hypothetical protein
MSGEFDEVNTDTGKKVVAKSEDNYDLKDPAQLPEYGEFTLSAFGLPEPMGMPAVTRRSSWWYLWFIVSALVCFAGAWYIRRRARIRMSASAVSAPVRS